MEPRKYKEMKRKTNKQINDKKTEQKKNSNRCIHGRLSVLGSQFIGTKAGLKINKKRNKTGGGTSLIPKKKKTGSSYLLF